MYCSFPRSLNAIGVFMNVQQERSVNGVTDAEGKEIIVNNHTADKYEQGKTLTGTPQSKPAPRFVQARYCSVITALSKRLKYSVHWKIYFRAESIGLLAGIPKNLSRWLTEIVAV